MGGRTQHLGVLIGVLLGNVIVFGQGMGKDKATAQEHHHHSHPMAQPAFASRTPNDKTHHRHNNYYCGPHVIPPISLNTSYSHVDFSLTGIKRRLSMWHEILLLDSEGSNLNTPSLHSKQNLRTPIREAAHESVYRNES